ncbi:hypothetical protein ACTFIW_001502 [Dictyostelium discoideum]
MYKFNYENDIELDEVTHAAPPTTTGSPTTHAKPSTTTVPSTTHAAPPTTTGLNNSFCINHYWLTNYSASPSTTSVPLTSHAASSTNYSAHHQSLLALNNSCLKEQQRRGDNIRNSPF